jgi:hypothetical protein
MLSDLSGREKIFRGNTPGQLPAAEVCKVFTFTKFENLLDNENVKA